MKNFFLIFLLIPILSFANANYMTFGGGNYIYAETGSLHFNFDKYVFDHRSWTYDGEKFTSTITVPMSLKTKYVSTDEWFEVVVNGHNDGFMYAKYIKEPFSSKNKGHYQVVAVPFVIAGAVGFIGRQFAFNNFKRHAMVGGAAAAATLFCSELLNASINCTTEGFTKIKNITRKIVFKDGATFYVENYDDFRNNGGGQAIVDRIEKASGNSYKLENCTITWVKGGQSRCGNWAWSQIIDNSVHEETITSQASDDELRPAFDVAALRYPSEVINEPTDGKKVQNVQLSAATLGNRHNVLSPPYTDPLTGNAQQDKLIIDTSSQGISFGANSSANTSTEATKGESATVNPTVVETIPRPDLNNDTLAAPVASPNTSTGTAPINPPVTSVPDLKIEFPEFTDIAEFCAENPNAGACIDLKPDESEPTPLVVPFEDVPLNFDVSSYFSNSGSCPAPAAASFSMFGVNRTIALSFEPTCQFASLFKYIVLTVAWILAFKIIMGRSE